MDEDFIPTEGSRFFIRNEAGTVDIEFEQHDQFTPPNQTRNVKERTRMKQGVEGKGLGILRTGQASLRYFVKGSDAPITEAKKAFDDVTSRVFTWMWPDGQARQWTVKFASDPGSPTESVEVDADMKGTLSLEIDSATATIPNFTPLTGA